MLNGYCRHVDGGTNTIEHDLRILNMAASMTKTIRIDTIKKSEEAQKTLAVISTNKTARRLAG